MGFRGVWSYSGPRQLMPIIHFTMYFSIEDVVLDPKPAGGGLARGSSVAEALATAPLMSAKCRQLAIRIANWRLFATDQERVGLAFGAHTRNF